MGDAKTPCLDNEWRRLHRGHRRRRYVRGVYTENPKVRRVSSTGGYGFLGFEFEVYDSAEKRTDLCEHERP